MATDLTSYIGVFDRLLAVTGHLLDKGAAHVGDNPDQILDWRLVEDMQPARFQVMVACNFTRQWPARVAGLEAPADVGVDLDLAAFKAQVAEARAWLANFDREGLAKADEAEMTFTIGNGMSPTMSGGKWIEAFAAPNLYFHVSMLYAILRQHGVPLGKIDFFAGGF
ncbi:MAG TPA: DUF1993 domain-containing protein [Caulobacteraceae bacterium]